MSRRVSFLWAACLLASGIAAGQSIRNWPAPASWSPSKAHGGMTTMDVTPPLPFIGLAPCRIADTRGNGFSGAYGPPALAAGAPRNFALSGRCGIPSGAGAVSLNITVTNTQGPGFILIYPQGGAQPAVSTLNYVAGQTVANAAVVALGTGGGVTVIAGVSGTQLIIDTNGYYASVAANQSNTFKVVNNAGSGVPAIWGQSDSGNLNATGVYGLAASGYSDPYTFGVRGVTQSAAPGSAGVYGVDGSGDPLGLSYGINAGVRGATSNGFGVLGVANSICCGVMGYLAAYGTQASLGVDSTYGVFAVGSIGATGTKPFIDPHPTDATKMIAYVALEGPEAGTYFRGRGRIHNGIGTISVPESFRLVTDDDGLTVQITPVGQAANVAVVSADLNSVVVRSPAKELEFYFVVNGVRRNFKDWSPIVENVFYVPAGPDARMPKAFSAEQRRVLVANGTYNDDGTVNMETAERLGWTRAWADRKAEGPEISGATQKAAVANK